MAYQTLIALAGLLALSGTAQAALTPVSSLPGATFASLTDPVGAIATAFGPYALGANAITLASSAGLERDQVANNADPYLDSNYVDGTQLVAQCGFAGYLTCNPAAATTLTFATPVAGFTLSADDFDTSQPYTFSLTAFDASGHAVGTLTASSLADNGSAPALLAALSTIPVASVRISDAPTGGGVGDGDFVLGLLGATPVPEPASATLLAASLLTLLSRRRR